MNMREVDPKTINLAMAAVYGLRVEPLFREGGERASAFMVTSHGQRAEVFETFEEATAYCYQCMWAAILTALGVNDEAAS